MGNDQGRFLDLLDYFGNSEGFARPRRPQKHLGFLSRRDAGRQLGNRLGLVPGRTKRFFELKFHGSPVRA